MTAMRVRLFSQLRPNSSFKAVRDYFARMSRPVANATTIAVVQCVTDLYHFALFGQIALSLRGRAPVRFEQVLLHSLNVTEGESLLRFSVIRLLFNPLFGIKWIGAYRSFCDGVGYRSVSLRAISDGIDFLRAWRIWRGLPDKQGLVQLSINRVPVGDLVYDSYLRYRPAPTVDLEDRYLLLVLWQAHRDVRRAQRYFGRTKPSFYLTSYSTYIQHGIAVRVALLQGTRVFSFANYQTFMKELSLGDWVHTSNADGYAREFARLPHQEEKLAAAEQALSTRIAGGIDAATAYMKKSAYAESGAAVPDVRGAVVVFLHDFYDSPHVYREMVFPDFWEWICLTIETLRASGIPFFLKPHPNQISLSDAALAELQRTYPGLAMISPAVTNNQLAEAGMACAVTVYGTVAHEMAFLGVPTIACAHHPHISFGFCRTARSRCEYVELLRNARRIVMDKAQMRRESLMFYYMHNLNRSADALALGETMVRVRSACLQFAEQADLAELLQEMSNFSGYQACIDQLLASVNVTERSATVQTSGESTCL